MRLKRCLATRIDASGPTHRSDSTRQGAAYGRLPSPGLWAMLTSAVGVLRSDWASYPAKVHNGGSAARMTIANPPDGAGEFWMVRMTLICCLAVFAVALALSGCRATANAQPAAPAAGLNASVQTGADTRPYSTRSKNFRECAAAAGHNAVAFGYCLEEELTYRERILAALVQERFRALDGPGREDLEAQQRVWRQQLDSLCGRAETGSAAREEAMACRIDGSADRFDLLVRYETGEVDQTVEIQPDAQGAFDVAFDDASVSLRSGGCDDRFRLICKHARLRVSTGQIDGQVLSLEQIAFRTPSPDSVSTLHRGSLASGFVDGWHSIMLSDLDMDGHEDLIVWTGFEGSYGDPSYTYFIYEPATRQLVENRELAELVAGHTVSRIEDGQLLVWYRSGPCERGEKTIDARGATPRIVDRSDINTCKERPE